VYASFTSLRDSIGSLVCDVDGENCTSPLTDGLPGAATGHDGGTWNTPGMVLDVAETGNLTEVQIVIFAGDSDSLPENDLANILGYNMDFQVWSDGIQGGPDSFFDNAVGQTIPGHTKVAVNRSSVSFISAQEFGITGPPNDPSLFTTFLITIDLSSFSLQLQGGQQYVVGITHPTGNFVSGGGGFRQTYSRATGFEDLYQQQDTLLEELPGFVNSQFLFGVDQLAGAVSIGNGNYDGDNDVDNDVDGADFLQWQRNFGQSVSDAQDSNGDGIADGADLAIWERDFGNTWPAPLAASATVPEPSSIILLLTAVACGLRRRRHG